MTTPDYGTDLRMVAGDLDPLFGLVSGPTAVAQSLALRLQTPEGGVFYDPDYLSLDLREYLSADVDDAELYRLRAKIERALRADERVDDLDLEVEFSAAAETLTVVAEGYGAEGPFRLVVAASAAHVAILEAR